jgi:hypothetical protein
MRSLYIIWHKHCNRRIITAILVAFCIQSFAEQILVQSTFDSGNEGWTQVNLGGDYRFLDVMEMRADGPVGPAGVLWFNDPDAGQWMFNAPEAYLGDKSVAMDGYIEFSSWDHALEDGTTLDQDPYPNIVIVSQDKAIVILNQSPNISDWTTYRYSFNLQSDWMWVDSETPMDNLPRATREQISQVLANVTALRIRGEAIIGDDQGWLDNIRLVARTSDERPTLAIRKLGENIEITWPTAAIGYVLESSEVLPSSSWSSIDTGTNSIYTTKLAGQGRYYRLRKAN